MICYVSHFLTPFLFYRHALLFSDMPGEYNIELAANAKTVKDFDEGLTRGIFFELDILFYAFIRELKILSNIPFISTI